MRSRVVEVFVLCAVVLCHSHAQFVIPEVDIQALTTGGLRVSIPDAPGIKMFGFHGRINAPLNGKEAGPIDGDVIAAKNGRWTFEDNKQMLHVDDVLNYRVFVQVDQYGYQREGLSYTVRNLVPPNTPWPTSGGRKPVPDGTGTGTRPTRPTIPPNCVQTITTINGGKPTCAGQLIFEENFNNPLEPSKWVVEQRLPADDQENEFVSYQKNTVKTSKSWLTITPTSLTSFGYSREDIISGQLDLSAGCTAPVEELCKLRADIMNILPPVVSGKVSTRGLFSFKYGKVEIRAKLPQGDWLYPQLYLQPQTSLYGTSGYSSGIMRVAFSRGNENLFVTGENIGSVSLSGGVVLDSEEPCRSKSTVTRKSETAWGTEFHTYGLIWTRDSIVYTVDGVQYGTLTPPPGGFKSLANECPNLADNSWSAENRMSPFDQEFYLSLGVGAGGTADFPDGYGNKGWNNTSPRARSSFFRGIISVLASWMDDSKSLTVDSVKVWAI